MRHGRTQALGIEIAFVVLVLSLGVSAWCAHFVDLMLQDHAHDMFRKQSAALALRLEKQVNASVGILQGVAGLFAASREVSRDEFAAYCRQLDFAAQLPGAISVNYLAIVPSADRAAFIERVRADTSVRPEGYPEFTIFPAPAGDTSYVLTYVEPNSAGAGVMGFDIASDPVRLRALERAQQLRVPAASDFVRLVEDDAQHAQEALIIYAPLLRPGDGPGEPEALLGFVSAAFRMSELLGAVLDHEDQQWFTLALQRDVEQVIAATQGRHAHDMQRTGRALSSMHEIHVAGQTWRLVIQAAPDYDLTPFERAMPVLTLIVNIVISLLLFGVLASLAISRLRAIKLAERMTEELRTQRDSLLVLDRAVASTADGVVITNPNARDNPIVYCNEGFERLTGYARQEVMGRNCRFLSAKDHGQEAVAILREAVKARRACRVTIRNYKKDGTMFWSDLTISPVVDERGRLLNFVGVQHDITAIKEAERSLRHVAAIIESSEDAILSLDLTGRVISWNASAARLYGYTAAEMFGKSLTRIVPPARAHEPAQLLESIKRGERVERHETVRVRKDGEQIEVAITASPVRDQAGVIIGASVIARDVSRERALERKEQEQARVLTVSNAELQRQQHVMRSLLEDLQSSKSHLEGKEQSLQAMNKRLQQLAILKDEFVAKVSHELRTPLTSIKEGMSLLLDNALGDTTAEQRDFLRTMDSDIDRLTELINNMLDLSKIEAGRMRLVRGRLMVRELAESVLRSHQPLFGKRTVEIQEEPGRPLAIFADRHRMLQIISNLFSNALKFTPDGGRICMRLGWHEGQVRMMVEDSGPGIAEEDLSKLFQKFSQVGPRDPSKPRGTGLGLVVCKELAELQGGRIEVASHVGQGSTFTVTLPEYSDELALTESVRELASQAHPEEGEHVALILIHAGAYFEAGAIPGRADTNDELADQVRRHVHRGDSVFPIQATWIAVLAVTDRQGVTVIAKRVHETLPGGGLLHMGAALFPSDAADAAALLSHARAHMDQGLTSEDAMQACGVQTTDERRVSA